MKDRLGKSRWINQPVANPTQSIFRRFIRVPESGLADRLKDSKAWDKFSDMALKTRLEEI